MSLAQTTSMIDRFLFSVGMILTIFFVVMKLMGKLEWGWLWILSPFWIWLILSFIRARLIVKPSIEKELGKKL